MDVHRMAVVLSVLFLTACSPSSKVAPPDSVPGSTSVPASSEVSLPATAAPTKTIGTPVPGWEEIPIMPGAYGPELEDMVYLYTVDTPLAQVEDYYQAKMQANGWRLTDRRELDAGPTGGPSTVLDYQKNDRLLNIMLVNLVKQNATSVVLSQLGP